MQTSRSWNSRPALLSSRPKQESFSIRAARLIRAIPCGQVATYGQIAMLAGNPQGARLVVWVLNSCSEREKLPWHRVINSKGGISLTGEGLRLQRKLLEAEGIKFRSDGTVDLKRFRWQLGSAEDGD